MLIASSLRVPQPSSLVTTNLHTGNQARGNASDHKRLNMLLNALKPPCSVLISSKVVAGGINTDRSGP